MLHDHPQLFGKDDLFNRHQFSLRIAQIIKNRTDKESIVFGINGAWGDGKTTVLNFISESLGSDYPKTIVIKFNPWRFSDEGRLLETFFASISTELSKSLKEGEKKDGMSSHERKEDAKKISDILGDYSEALGEIPIPGFVLFKGAKTVLKKFSTTELEQKKNELSTLISKYQRKIVIIIDDIDRLSKDEVYTIFRLVKLTGDFNHLIYLLAYDEAKVAAAIGQRFSDDDKNAGRSFIEKIVQIPIKLPEITFHDLNRFFSTSFEKILSDNKIVVDESTKYRFERVFSETLIFNLDSPRKVVRYINSIQFSLPLMQGEVNFADLLLFEGLKIFYPKHYAFINENTEYFLSDNSKIDGNLKKVFNEEFNAITNILSKRDIKTINELILDLFPTINGIWKGVYSSVETSNQWTREKRIVSREYFTRYLTYSLSKTDVSDRDFESFIGRIKLQDPNNIAKEFITFTKLYDVGMIVQKLRLIEDTFTQTESENISLGLSQSGNHLPRYEGFMVHTTSPSSQGAILIAKLIRNIKDHSLRLKVATDLCIRATPITFAFEINNWIRSLNESSEMLKKEDFQFLGEKLKDRIIQESYPEPFFVKFPHESIYTTLIWSTQDREHLIDYLRKTIDQNPKYIIDLLKSFVGKVYTLGSHSSQVGDISQRTIGFIEEMIGLDWIYETVSKLFNGGDISEVILDTSYNNNQTDENLIKQFLYLYQKKFNSILKHD